MLRGGTGLSRNLGLTFAGGGNRAFYQMGLLSKWGPDLLERTAAIAACSAGACVVTTYLADRREESWDFWRERRAHVTQNIRWANLLKGERPAPHGPIYRDTLLHTYADGGLERIRAQPFPIYILCAKLPKFTGPVLATLMGMTGYSLEKKAKPAMIHPKWTRAMGFAPMIADARDCQTPEELTNLVLASSATPPFTPVGRFRGTRLLDGGLVDNVPAFVAEKTPEVRGNIVFLTRTYPAHVTGLKDTRLYVAPTTPVPVGRWDYTRPDLLEDTITMGEVEAEHHAHMLAQFLEKLTKDPAVGARAPHC